MVVESQNSEICPFPNEKTIYYNIVYTVRSER